MEPSILKSLIAGLVEKSAIKKLSLSGMAIYDDSFELLIKYLTQARLITLKLSGIHLQYYQYQ